MAVGLRFKTISFANFLSVGQSPIVINLEDPDSYLIVGLNGAGKSTIVDAITYGLFGRPYRKINKPQLVNAINKKNMLVELEFDRGSHMYKIRRGMKPNVFEVYCDGKLLNQDASGPDYQKELEKTILKMNYAVGRQIVLLSKTSYKPFMDLDAKERRLVIEDLLGIEIFTEMGKLLTKQITATKNRLVEVQKDLGHTGEKIEIIRDNVARFVQNTEDLVRNKQERIETFQSKLDIALDESATIQPQIEELTAECDALRTKARSRRENILEIKNKIESRRRPMVRDLQFFEHTSECPTCAQELSESYRHQAIKDRKEGISDLDAALAEADKRLERLADLTSEIQERRTVLDVLNTKIIEHRTSIAHCRSSIRALEREIEELKNQSSDYEADYIKIDELQKLKKNLSLEKKTLLEQAELFKAASFLLKDGGIKAQIIKQYIPIINKYINKYLAAMDFFVDFQLDENFNEVILSRHRDEFSYHSFSEGEKFRIDLALMLTWRAIAKLRNSCVASILFLDEIFDGSLDDIGIEDFLKLIDTLVAEGTGVYVISHKGDRLLDKFENVLKFEKIKNFTTLVED